MAVTTRRQEHKKTTPSSPSKKRGDEQNGPEETPSSRKERKIEQGPSNATDTKETDTTKEEQHSVLKTNNSNAIANNEKNQPLLDALDELANAMFAAENADDKNRFKGVAIKNAVPALAKVNYEITSGSSVSQGENKIRGVGRGTANYIDEFLSKGEIKETKQFAKLGEEAQGTVNEKEEEGTEHKSERAKGTKGDDDYDGVEDDIVNINRAPVLTLWVAVVAQREGFSREEAVTYGKWVATVFAQSKGRALGRFSTSKGPPAEEHKVEQGDDEILGTEPDHVLAFGDKKIPILKDRDGNRLAVLNEDPVDPNKVEDYLQRKFGDKLRDTEDAMKELADNMEVDELKEHAYDLYKQIRPEWKGWGKKGALNLSEIRQFAH